MRILLTNDDGYEALGIIVLALALYKKGHELLIAAPDSDQSCVSHSLTLRRPLNAKSVTIPGLEKVRAYAIDGTPSDCVRLAMGNLDFDPDLVVSGINNAPNLGTDAVYSGTVSAAIEAVMVDKPAIAVAKDKFTLDHMDDAAAYFVDLLPTLMRYFEGRSEMLSINIPSTVREEYRGVKVAPLALQSYALRFDEADENGRTAYSVRKGKLTVCADDEDSDEKAMRDGYVVITPLTYDITDYKRISSAKSYFERQGDRL